MRLRFYLLLLLLRDDEEQDERFTKRLNDEGRRRRDRRIPRVALQLPSMSTFVRLFASGSDQALITFTGFDHAAFHGNKPSMQNILF